MNYSRDFFADHAAGSASSAERVAPLIFDAVTPETVIDVGCGTGDWAAAFAKLGADVIGLDGDYVDRGQLRIEQSRFRPVDLAVSVGKHGRFDLAISLEVAEHLPPSRGPGFVDELVSLAPAVLFSAAIPGQGGTGHVNERWQDEWAREFARHDYRPVDLIRNALWGDRAVEPWYLQNALLWLAPSAREEPPAAAPAMLRVVHPRLFTERTERTLTPRELASKVPATARSVLRHRLKRFRTG